MARDHDNGNGVSLQNTSKKPLKNVGFWIPKCLGLSCEVQCKKWSKDFAKGLKNSSKLWLILISGGNL
jgi:hypothetical protein